ncbi:RagB/SusD family nutrient uptake outer membrane protein [Mucilaginibacter sp. UYCu711]|uniref:RagB/SusD family nutrient uptake outer membrane protein n=1 Tax=Mucilaginibacter sp. UYCu711 TaxID=3156339 RepID=UPI003D256016
MKNYHKQTIKAIFGILLISLPLWSCKKFVDIKPTTSLLGEFIFDNDATVKSALNGVYIKFSSNYSSAYTEPALYADELTYAYDKVPELNAYTPDISNGFFDRYYATIYSANAILEGIGSASKITPATAALVKGEALYLRAFSYFQLVNYYGTVPYVTMTDANISGQVGNTPVATIYQNIIADLKTSAGLLMNAYPVPNRTRINKQAVNALLAKAYLYTKDWVNAASTADLVIGSGIYSINNDLNAVFAATSNETIFQVWNSSGTALGNQFLQYSPTSSVTYPIRPELVNSFAANDLRKGTYIKPGTGPALATNTYVVSKYKANGATAGQPVEYPIIFRLAEIYLIRAEALAQQATPASIAAGASDLQVIRTRAGLTTPLVISTSTQLLTALADERRKELSFELGNRWFDIKRTDQALAVLQPLKPGIDAHILLLPFLRKYTTLNKNLIQNLGYK